jgi:DNA-binding NarL/FixJ family response regulator
MPDRTRVLCVEDRRDVAEAVRLLIGTDRSLEWTGCLEAADNLVEEVESRVPPPEIVILDATMPGKDPLSAVAVLAARCPASRVILYTGHDDSALIRRAREAGAWAFVSKHDDPVELLRVIGEVAAGRAVWPRG